MMMKLHMNNPAKVSVTVPVYNTAQYLDRCLSSLVAQTLQDIEIVVVNDGSTDGSDKICDSWASRDRRIKVIHQRNGGLWKARQTGLENATGEYIIVCDSDDWVDKSTYEKAYTKAKTENTDIVIFGYIAEYPNGDSKECIRKFKDLTDIELTRNEIMRSSYYHSWNKLIRRSLFASHNICYEPGINMGEDQLILQKILSIRPLKVCCIPEALYHYRINSGGYTTTIKPEYIDQLIKVFEWDYTNLDKDYHSEALKQISANLAFESLRCLHFPSDKFKSITASLPTPYLYKSPRSPQKLMVLAAKIFGWRFGRWAYNNIYQKIYS